MDLTLFLNSNDDFEEIKVKIRSFYMILSSFQTSIYQKSG